MHVYIYIYMHIYIYIFMCIYIYMCIERLAARHGEREVETLSPP